MDQPYNPINDLFSGNKITFGGRIDWLPVKPPRVTTPTQFDNFTLLFRNHSEPAPEHIIDTENKKHFPFNLKRFYFERRPENAEAVFTAFPGQPYLLEKPGCYWPIIGLPFPGIVKKSPLVETQAQLPASHGQIHQGQPPQAFDKK